MLQYQDRLHVHLHVHTSNSTSIVRNLIPSGCEIHSYAHHSHFITEAQPVSSAHATEIKSDVWLSTMRHATYVYARVAELLLFDNTEYTPRIHQTNSKLLLPVKTAQSNSLWLSEILLHTAFIQVTQVWAALCFVVLRVIKSDTTPCRRVCCSRQKRDSKVSARSWSGGHTKAVKQANDPIVRPRAK